MDGHGGGESDRADLPGNLPRGDGSGRDDCGDEGVSAMNETKVMPMPSSSTSRRMSGGSAAAARRRRMSGGSHDTRRGSASRVAFPSRKALASGRHQMAMLAQDARVSVRDGVVEDNLHAFKPTFGAAFNFSHYLSDQTSSVGSDQRLAPVAGSPNLVAQPLGDGESSGGGSPAKSARSAHGGGAGAGDGHQGGDGASAQGELGKGVTWASNVVKPTVDTGSAGSDPKLLWGKLASAKQKMTPSSAAKARRLELAKSAIKAAKHLSAGGVLGKIFGTKNKDFSANDEIIVTEKYMLHPTGVARQTWDVILSMLVILTLFWTPFEIGFSYSGSFNGTATQMFWAVVDIMLLVFFTVDMLVNFRTAIIDDGELIEKPRDVAFSYIKGWFVLDLIATVPYELILKALFPSTFDSTALAWAQIPRFVRFLRLIRFMRMIRVLKLQKMVEHLAEIGAFASLLGRLCNIAFWVLLIAHVLGCGWFFLADINSSDRITWAHEFDLHQPDAPLSTKYITSLYWAFVTVTTVGYGDIVPRTDGERIYVIVCTFIGNSMFAFMIGKITSLASQMDASQALYHEKMDAVNEFMRSRGLPRPLRKRIRKYYNTFWSRGVYFSESDIVGELSFNIRRELAHFMNEDIIRNVPFFRDANELFIDELLTYLKAEVCLPDDYIIREGDTGSKMYLLRKGAVAVVKDGEVSHTLTRGAFFGEITLLFPAVRRTASVKALSECEMASLSKADLEKVAEHYPDFLDMMSTVAKSHLKKDENHEKQAAAKARLAGSPVAPRRDSTRRRSSITKDGASPAWLAQLKSFADDVDVGAHVQPRSGASPTHTSPIHAAAPRQRRVSDAALVGLSDHWSGEVAVLTTRVEGMEMLLRRQEQMLSGLAQQMTTIVNSLPTASAAANGHPAE